MKTKLLVLMAILLLVPFVSASAAPFTLDKVKKAGEIWLKGGDDFGASDWVVEDFDSAAKLSGKTNPKSNTVALTLTVDRDFYFAVFKKNSRLKYWGLAKYDGNGGYSLQKERKKSFIRSDWAFRKEVPLETVAPADTSEGNALPEDKPTGGVENNSVGGGSEGKVEVEEEIIILADQSNNGNEGNGDPSPNGPAPVPEPATMLLLGSGLIGLAGAARRKVKKARK